MVTGHTDAIEKYNEWFTENYTGLRKYCKRYRIDEDLLNDVYCNIYQRILRSGFTESYYNTYVKRSIRNLKINEEKKLNNKHWIDYDNEDYTNTVEERLQEQDETERDAQEYREEIMYLSKMIFKFIDERFKNDEEKFIFRCYYLMEGRMTYKKLNIMTGINKNQCTKVIQNFKRQIRNDFLTWLKDDKRRNN